MRKSKNERADVPGKTHYSDDSSLHFYMKDICKIPILSKEEEQETAKKAREGDEAAREKLVTSNLRFVIMIAKKYRGRGIPLPDLISEGNIGLMHAASNFDVERGYRFISYAVWWIRQSIIKALSDKGRMIRLPINKVNDLKRIENCRQKEGEKKGRSSDEEIREAALFLNIAPEKALALVKAGQEVVSLDEPVSQFDPSVTVKDKIEDVCNESPDEYAANSMLRDEVETMLDCLEKRTADIIRCRYGLDRDSGVQTLREVGDRNQLSRERVRQLEVNALLQLQHSPRCAQLEVYVAG